MGEITTKIKTKMIKNLNLAIQSLVYEQKELLCECILKYFSDTTYLTFVRMRDLIVNIQKEKLYT